MTYIDSVLFNPGIGLDWHMQNGERVALLYALSRCNPDISIEIGTYLGGSLRPISAASRHVYTLDIDDRRINGLSNVDFIAGDSSVTLPPIIRLINHSERELNFVLIDGDHSEDGVRRDIKSCLQYRPKRSPAIILMHDSSNPDVRRGIATAPWADCPFIHHVDLDYVHGLLFDREDIRGQIWGGFAMAVMHPHPRVGDLVITRHYDAALRSMVGASVHATRPERAA